jgi:hypothetical protein
MKTYQFVVMSVDPHDNSEDPHQKYSRQMEGESEKDAREKVAAEFGKKGLPIHWIKCYGEVAAK